MRKLLILSIAVLFMASSCGVVGQYRESPPVRQSEGEKSEIATPENDKQSEKGISETKEVPFSKETIDEIKKRESTKPEVIREPRVVPFQKQQPPKKIKEPSPEPEKPDVSPEPQSNLIYEYPQSQAPTLSNNFSGLGDNGTDIPTDTMGTAGPSHLMEILNI